MDGESQDSKTSKNLLAAKQSTGDYGNELNINITNNNFHSVSARADSENFMSNTYGVSPRTNTN